MGKTCKLQVKIHYDIYLVNNKICYDTNIGINAKFKNIYDVNIVRVFIHCSDWLVAGVALKVLTICISEVFPKKLLLLPRLISL